MYQKIIAIYRALVAFSIMTITGFTGIFLRIISFDLLLKFNRKYLIANSSKLILFLIGIRLKLPENQQWPKQQVLFTFNHNSYLDVLILTALGLENTAFFLSTKTIKIIPLTLSAIAIGTIYIPLKKDKKKRLEFFLKIEKKLPASGISVFASSEGPHTFIHGIAAFNKGIYCMAVICGLPIVPVYFHIPKNSNPLEGYKFKSGVVSIEILPIIETTNWQLDHISNHVKTVRQIFIDKFNELNK